MVQRASENESRAWGALPSAKEMAFRRISSVFLMAGLLTVIMPFTPFQWIIPSEGPALLDGFISPVLYLGALFFQWRISGVVGNLLCNFSAGSGTDGFAFVYHHGMYWTLALGEVVLCLVVGMLKNEILRRVTAVGIIGGLWSVGWFATPQVYKNQAWDIVKWLWTVMAIDHARSAVGARRARY